MSSTVVLISSDDESFEVPVEVACMSTTIKNMLTDLEDTEGSPIQLPNVRGVCLRKVLEFCKHHYENPTPSTPIDDKKKKRKKDEMKNDDIDPWDREFMNVEQSMLFELIMVFLCIH